jgi:predicted SAM-dependent methyltransferase
LAARQFEETGHRHTSVLPLPRSPTMTAAPASGSVADHPGRDKAVGQKTMTDKAQEQFPLDYDSGGNEVRKSYQARVASGFMRTYLSGPVVLDIGHQGGGNPGNKTVVPNAIDLDYPGYDGMKLPFPDGSVDCVFSSHCLEHIWFANEVIRDHHRVLKVGGFIVCIVPHKHLYEKALFPPSLFNPDHKRFLTPATLLAMFEESLHPNSYRVRHLRDNDRSFDYAIGPNDHSDGCYEVELVIQKIRAPAWRLRGS